MNTPSLERIQYSTDIIFENSPLSPTTGEAPRQDGSTMEKANVRYEMATQGFPTMSEYKNPYLTVRRINDTEGNIARRIIELTLLKPYDKTAHTSNSELYIITAEDLFTAPLAPGFESVGRFANIQNPIQENKKVKVATEIFRQRFLAKLSKVADVATK